MKKLFMFMLMAMILSISGWSQETVTFGGTSSTSANTSPLPGYYGYHRSAIVYKPEELADMPSTCNITSIAWRMGGTSNAGGNVSIYLKEIADTAIAGSATWDDVLTDATLVYQGSATAAANTWAEFEFDTPYQYQGGNLVVITQGEGCTTSGGCSKSMYYTGTMGSTTATLSSAWTVYQDSSPQASTVALSGWSTKNHNKYDIKLTYLPADGDYCAGVSGLTKSNVLASTATISWNEREDNATIYVQIKTASQDWEDADEYTTTDNYVDLTDLEPNTEYDVRVMADCGSSQSTYRTTSFRTTCLLISEIPQTWDFENTDHGAGTSSYPLPSCWGRITTSTSSLYPYCYSSSTNAHSGTYSLYWYNSYKNSLAILPPIDTEVLPLTDLRLAFYAKISTATTAAKLQVGVMTDPTDSTTFTVVDSLTLTTTHTLYEVDFNEYEGEGNYIALRNAVTGSTYSYIYVDDMELMHIPACTRPDNIAGETTTDGATLTWTSTGENFVLYYKEYGTEEWLEYIDAQATDTGWVMNLTDLTPATYYLFYIKAICGEDELSTETYIVRTECELLTELPYVCDFETVPPIANPLPVCWTKGAANATYPYSCSTTNAYEGSRALYFYTANYAALPPIDPNAIDLSTTQLTFFARGTNAGYKLQVGVMTDPTNASTFEQISSITLTSNYELYEIPLSSYEGEGTYVALRDTASNFIYVDNLSLEVIPACSRPSDIAVETAVNSATVSWTSDGDDFEVYYKQKGTNEWQVAANFVQGEAENTWSAEIDDLLEATQYVFYVKATCEGEPRSFDQSFVTRQTPVDLPYETNFSNEDDANRAWLFQNHTSENYWTFGSIGTGENEETIYGMYITNDGTTSTYSHSATRVSAEKLFTTGGEGQLHLEFDVAAGGESTYDYLKVFITPASWTFPASTSEAWFSINNYSGSADSNIYVLNFSDYAANTTNTSASTYPYLFNLTTDTVHISQDIFNPNPNGDMKVTFMWRNDGSGGTQIPAVEISNFSISAIECSAPAITITDITTESATVTLPEGNDYVVEYKLASDDEGAWQSATVTGAIAEITGLENTTQYSVRAAMVCGNELSEYSEGTFTTLQVAVDMPYATDFSGDEATGDRAWLFQNHTSVNHWVFGQPTTGHPAMYITNNDTTLVSSYTITSATRVSAEKLFNADGGEQIHLEFDVKSAGEGGYDYLKVFITPASWTFPASATEETYSVRGYSGNAEENIYVLDFSEYASGTTYASFSTSPYAYNLTNGNTIHISKEITNPDPDGMVKVTFMWRNDGSGGTQPAVEISNFAIANVVCPTPEFTVDTMSITPNSAIINLPEEGSYNVAYKPDSDLITEWEEIEDANGAITLSDLNAVTTYIVKVVRVCDEGLSFETTHSFTTACGAIATLPWTMNFDSETATIPNCWDRANVYSTYPKVTSSSHYHSASKKLEFHASTTNSIAILPPFVTDLTELQVSFWSQREGTSSGTLTVGYVKDSADTVAFVPVVSYTAASMGNNDYQFFEVPFNQVEIEEGDNPRIAFAYNTSGASSSYYWFIDDITVEPLPECTRPVVANVEPTTNDVTITWTSTGEDFVVYYKAVGSEEYLESTDFVAGEEENVYSITLTGLSESTSYEFYVAAICGDTPIESIHGTFSTMQSPVDLPYETDFSDEEGTGNRAWLFNNHTSTNYWMFGATGTNENEETTYGMFVTNNGTTSSYTLTSATRVSAEKTFTTGSEGQLHLEFDVAAGGESTYDYLKVFITPASWTFPASTSESTYSTSGYSGNAEDGIYVLNFSDYASQSTHAAAATNPYKYNLTNGTVHISQDVFNPNPNGDIKVTFMWRNDSGSGTQPAVTISDFSISAVACSAPIVSVSDITVNSAKLVFNEEGTYTVKYKTASDEDWTEDQVTGEEYEITGLEAATTYAVQVAQQCDDELSSFTTLTFSTTCDVLTSLPQTWDFETEDEDSGLPPCWTSTTTANRGHYIMSGTGYNGSSHFLRLWNNSNGVALAVLPPFDTETYPVNNLQLRFRAMNLGTYPTWDVVIKAGVMTDLNDVTTFATVDTVHVVGAAGGSYLEYTLSLEDYEGEGEYIALGFETVSGSQWINVDDLTLELREGETPEPVQPTVVTNAATEVSQTSAVLNGAITDEGNQTITARGFEWKLATATDYTVVSATGTTMTATLTGLTANTTYTYKAFATTALGTVYGSELTFTTLEQGEEPCTPVSMTITETVCFGETYTFNGQTYNATGTYTTTVAGQGTDCDTNYTINLTVLPQNTASETVTVCAGATATFNGQTLTEGTNTITVAGQGTDCDTLYTVTLVVLQPTSSTTDVTVCYGETYEFNGQTYNATGTYTATLTNAAGCDSVATLNLTVRPANAPIEETVTLNNDELPYTWRGEQYTEFGTYTVAGEDENGCPQEYVLTLVHNSGIAEVENEYSIALYPNPTSENATLSVKGLNEEATVIVTDQAGRVISTTKLALGQETMEVETTKLASGVYYIRIQTANSVRTEKLIRK